MSELQNYVDRQRNELEKELDLLITGTKYCIPDPPLHDNKGDSAIYTGETSFMTKRGKTLTSWDDKTVDLVLLHGGGNFGDTWKMPHLFRLLFMKINREKKMIMCPQSVYYKDKAHMKSNMELINYIIEESNITFLVRDDVSYELLVKELRSPQIVKMVPDIAFLNTNIPSGKIQYDVVVLARTDVESTSGCLHSKESNVISFCKALGFSVKFGDWLSSSGLLQSPEEPFLQPNPQKYDEWCNKKTKEGFEYLAEGAVILTDRLHGHILSSLLGKPQVIMDNNYGKISSYIRTWKPPANKVMLVDNLNTALDCVKKLVLATRETK